MFFTGIVTSLLPYILLIGVFGTLLWNNTFQPSEQDKSTATTEDLQAGHTTGKDLRKACRFEDHQQTIQPQAPDQSIYFKSPYQLQPTDICSHTTTGFIHHLLPGTEQAGLNRNFSFRGPPLLS